MKELDDSNPLTINKVAKYCHVNRKTVGQWIKEGKIMAYQTPGGHSRVQREDFAQFLKEYKMPIPADFMKQTGKIRVLIIDDDKQMVEVMREVFLEEGGFEVEVAYDGFNVGKKFAIFQPDIILLDIRMPKLDGYEVCKNIRKDPQGKHTKIIIVSGLKLDELEFSLAEIGADDYQAKPYDINDFADLVDKVRVLFGEKA